MFLRKSFKTKDEKEFLKYYISLIALNKLTEVELNIYVDVLLSKDKDVRTFVKRYSKETKNSAPYVRIYLYKLRDKGFLKLDEKFEFPKNIKPPDNCKIEFNLEYER